jgi:hypothetical protein
VDALNGTVASLHLPETFVGVVIVAIVETRRPHRADLRQPRRHGRGARDRLGVLSKQIAPAGGARPGFVGILLGAMDLAFSRFRWWPWGSGDRAGADRLDGETNWLVGHFPLAVYAVLGLGFFFVG